MIGGVNIVEFFEGNPWSAVILLLVGGLVSGFIVEKLLFAWISSVANRTRWKGDEIIIDAMRAWVSVWFALLFGYFSVGLIPIAEGPKSYIIHGLFFAAVLSVSIVLNKIAKGLINIATEHAKDIFPITTIFSNFTGAIIFSVAGLVILQYLGISITPILTALGVGGLAVALALQETLSNVFAGFNVLASREFKPGDFIEVGDEKGRVTDISWRNTTLRTLGGNMVVIPNAVLAKSVVKNYAIPRKSVTVGINYGVDYKMDLEKVEKVAREVGVEVMKNVEGGDPNYEPLIRFKELGDAGIDLVVYLRAKEYADQFRIRHEFVKRASKRFKKEKIEIPFPTYAVILKKR